MNTTETVLDTALTTSEQDVLVTCESIIERGLATFIDVGTALQQIRDSHLYRADHKTFEDYCQQRWALKRTRAYELMSAATVVRNLSEISDKFPSPITESHAAALETLEPKQQVEAWQEAVTTAPNGKVTAAHIQRVVNQHRAHVGSFDPDDALEDQLPPDERQQRDREPGEVTAVQNVSHWDTVVPPLVELLPANGVPASEVVNGKPHNLAVLQSSESNEWYTPAKYIEAARTVMGDIDLDPASCAYANLTVRAADYFSKETDGFNRAWRGRVWMNPPYGRESGVSNQARWSAKLITEYEAGDVDEAIMLVNAVTERVWFQPLWEYPICFTDHRIVFGDETGEDGDPTHGNVLVYFGKNVTVFAQQFSQFGHIVIPHSQWSEVLNA